MPKRHAVRNLLRISGWRRGDLIGRALDRRLPPARGALGIEPIAALRLEAPACAR